MLLQESIHLGTKTNNVVQIATSLKLVPNGANYLIEGADLSSGSSKGAINISDDYSGLIILLSTTNDYYLIKLPAFQGKAKDVYLSVRADGNPRLKLNDFNNIMSFIGIEDVRIAVSSKQAKPLLSNGLFSSKNRALVAIPELEGFNVRKVLKVDGQITTEWLQIQL